MKREELKGLKETVEGIINKLDSFDLNEEEKTLLLTALKDKIFQLDIEYQRSENYGLFEEEKLNLK